MTSVDTQTLRHLQQENIRLRGENGSLIDYVERLQKALRALVDLQTSIERITSETNIFSLINNILSSAIGAVDSENGSLLLLDQANGELVFVEVIGVAREKLLNYRLPKGTGIAAWSVKNREVRLVEDVRKDPLFSPQVDQFTGLNTTSILCAPLIHENRPLGAIEIVNTRSGRPFTESDKEIIVLVAKFAAEAIAVAEKAAST